MTGVLIIMNNYFHDVATAVLLSSAVILAILERRARRGSVAELRALRGAYPALTRFAQGALVWIVLGGIPRVIFFTRYEWDPAIVKGLVPALIIKHTLMVAAVLVGGLLWWRASRRAKRDEAGARPLSSDAAAGTEATR